MLILLSLAINIVERYILPQFTFSCLFKRKKIKELTLLYSWYDQRI